ncbi:MAG: hypothetical protein HYS98_02230 [Deltaproteobacteria bacterium]|nr:hypothetical protein [Deltaproteobacteria bacterium]
MKSFKRGFKKSSDLTKRRLLRRVIDRLIFSEDGLKVYYVLDDALRTSGSQDVKKGTAEFSSVVPHFKPLGHEPKMSWQPRLVLSQNASRFQTGGGGENCTPVQRLST